MKLVRMQDSQRPDGLVDITPASSLQVVTHPGRTDAVQAYEQVAEDMLLVLNVAHQSRRITSMSVTTMYHSGPDITDEPRSPTRHQLAHSARTKWRGLAVVVGSIAFAARDRRRPTRCHRTEYDVAEPPDSGASRSLRRQR
jgi:hypothetical protein